MTILEAAGIEFVRKGAYVAAINAETGDWYGVASNSGAWTIGALEEEPTHFKSGTAEQYREKCGMFYGVDDGVVAQLALQGELRKLLMAKY